MSIWPPVGGFPQPYSKVRGRGIVRDAEIREPEGGNKSIVEGSGSGKSENITVKGANPELQVCVPASKIKKLAPTTIKLFTIDMSNEPPPIPIIFDPEAEVKKRDMDEDDEDDEDDVLDSSVTCLAGNNAVEHTEIGWTHITEMGVSPSSDVGLTGIHNVDPTISSADFPFKVPEARPRSAVSTASTSSDKSKQKEETDVYEEFKSWCADPRFRKQITSNRVTHSKILDTHHSVEMAKVNNCNSDEDPEQAEEKMFSANPDIQKSFAQTLNDDFQNADIGIMNDGNQTIDHESVIADIGITTQDFSITDSRDPGNGIEMTPSTGSVGPISFAESHMVPQLYILPYTPINQPERKTAVKMLKELGDQYKIKVVYTFENEQNSEDNDVPHIFQVSVRAGLREGSGSGGTRMEAMCEAAEECIRSLKRYNPTLDLDMDFRQWTKTETSKDILLVLKRVCKDYGFMTPEYKCKADENGGYMYTCIVGTNMTEEFAGKKRVAIRMAALSMYEKIQKIHNDGK